MGDRPRHTDKEVEDAIQYAETKGWRCDYPRGHWGRLFCAHADREGCQVGVSGTPKNPGTHARQLKRAIDRCPHEKGNDDEGI